MSEITGTIVVRDTNKKLPSHPGKRIVMVLAVVAIDEDAEIKGERSYPILGNVSDGMLTLRTATESGTPLPKDVANHRADQLLTANIWRV